jgi:AcrR family transcriptional regulator
MQKSERRLRQRAANKAAIIDAAREIAEHEGAGELSLRAAAAKAGYAPASVYEYFQNRADLVLNVAADDLSRIARSLKSAPRDAAHSSLSSAARVLLDALNHNGPLAAAAAALQSAEAPTEAERLFNGKLIAAMTAFAEASGRSPVKGREVQADVVLAISALIGLSVLARAGRLKPLGFTESELLERMERRFTDATA